MRRATPTSPAWELIRELAPDVALLQEVDGTPEFVSNTYQVVLAHPTGKAGRPQRFSTAILVRGTLEQPIHLASPWQWVNRELVFFRGNLLAHQVTLEAGGEYRLLSVYSPAWPVNPKRLTGVDVDAVKLHHSSKLWVTELVWAALLDARIDEQPPWIIGGDFNTSETFDYLWPGGPHGNLEVLERMRALGLTECLRHKNGGPLPTFRNPRDGKLIHQIDHLFVPNRVATSLLSCTTADRNRVFGPSLSDHLPIVAEFADPDRVAA
jgi:endonuclease/exonuclease/phosphatase family metal-dependent hydrolase